MSPIIQLLSVCINDRILEYPWKTYRDRGQNNKMYIIETPEDHNIHNVIWCTRV